MHSVLDPPHAVVDDHLAADVLFGTLYAELHRLARRELHRHGPIGGLGVTTLLHEAYLSMTSRQTAVFADQARFMGYAARVMRGLIVDDYRRRRSEKRGGLFHITSLGTHHGAVVRQQDLVKMSEALDALAEVDAGLAEIIDLKFFCGFSFGEIAAMRGVAERTIQRGWEKGRLYLHHALAGTSPAAAAYAAHQS